MFNEIINRWKRWLNSIMEEPSEKTQALENEETVNTLSEDPCADNKSYPIHLLIAENVITVMTTRQAEGSLRVAAKQVNRLVDQYKEHCPDSTNEQLLSYAALKAVLDNIQK